MDAEIKPKKLDAETIIRVRTSFDRIKPEIRLFAQVFYSRLFEQNPNIALMFPADLEKQEAKFGAMISTVIRHLDDMEGLTRMLENLGRRHIEEFGVRPADFENYGVALWWTVDKFLDDDFTSDVADAWDEFFRFLTDTMLCR